MNGDRADDQRVSVQLDDNGRGRHSNRCCAQEQRNFFPRCKKRDDLRKKELHTFAVKWVYLT
jgi:hypothetical protein